MIENVYADNLSSQLQFMKTEFESNIKLQKQFIKELQRRGIRKQCLKENHEREDKNILALSQVQEIFLKGLLLKQINAPTQPCDLKTLISLAIAIKNAKSKIPSMKFFQFEYNRNQQSQGNKGFKLKSDRSKTTTIDLNKKDKQGQEITVSPFTNPKYEKTNNDSQIMFGIINGQNISQQINQRPLHSMIKIPDTQKVMDQRQYNIQQASIQKYICCNNENDYNQQTFKNKNNITHQDEISLGHSLCSDKSCKQKGSQNLSLICIKNCDSKIMEGERISDKLDQSQVIRQVCPNFEQNKQKINLNQQTQQQSGLCFRKNIIRKIGKPASKNIQKVCQKKQIQQKSSKIIILEDTFKKTWEIFNNIEKSGGLTCQQQKKAINSKKQF